MLFTRNYPSGKGGVIGAGEKVLLALPASIKQRMKKKARKYAEKWNNHSDYPLVNFCTLDDASFLFPPDMMDELTELEFADKKYLAVRDYDRILSLYFGNYKQLPPEDQRASHYPLLLDFEKEYHAD